MDTKLKIAIFPCGTEIALEIIESLRNVKFLELYGLSSVKYNHGKYLLYNYFDEIGFVDDSNFIESLNKYIEQNKIDFLFPAHDQVIYRLSLHITEIKCKLLSHPPETGIICRSKSKTYELLKNEIKTPKLFSDFDKIEFPVFLKPDVGEGSKNTYKIDNLEELLNIKKKYPDLLILEYLPGPEFTVDCFTNKDKKLIFCMARKRNRIMNGISVNTEPVEDNSEFSEIGQKINNLLKFRGAWFFQIKKDKDNKNTLLEVGPRIAGSMSLYRNLGINFALMTIYDAIGYDLKILSNLDFFKLEMDRALISRFIINFNFNHVYIDLDDTIIINGKVNTLLIALIYQFINNGKKIHLITKSNELHLKKKLVELKIFHLFDEIIHLQLQDKKSDYIKFNDSIFIDDSFSERYNVYNEKKIPTFDMNAFFFLYDWRI